MERKLRWLMKAQGLAHVLDPEAAPDPETDLVPGLAQGHDQGATAPDRDHVPSHGPIHHDAGHSPSHALSQSHVQSLDLVPDPLESPSLDRIHVLDHDHPKMKKRRLLSLRSMIIKTRIQEMVMLKLSPSNLLFLGLLFGRTVYRVNKSVLSEVFFKLCYELRS